MGKLSELLSSAAQWSSGMNQGLNVLARREKDISDTRLFSEQVNLQKMINDQFQSFDERDDFNNFTGDIETLINKGQHKALSGARNNYEARQIKQLYESTYVNSLQKAKDIAWNKETDRLNTTMNQNILQSQQNLYAGDNLPSNEEIYQNYIFVNDQLNKAVANGRLTHAQASEYSARYIPSLALGLGVKLYKEFEKDPYAFIQSVELDEEDRAYYNELLKEGDPQKIIKAFTEAALNEVDGVIDFLKGGDTDLPEDAEGIQENIRIVEGVDRGKIKSELSDYIEAAFNKTVRENYEATFKEQSNLITEYTNTLKSDDYDEWIRVAQEQMDRLVDMDFLHISQEGKYTWYNRWRGIYEEALKLKNGEKGNPKAAAADYDLKNDPDAWWQMYYRNPERFGNVYGAETDFFDRNIEDDVSAYIDDNKHRIGKEEGGVKVTAQMLALEGQRKYEDIDYWKTKTEKLEAFVEAGMNNLPSDIKKAMQGILSFVEDLGKLEDNLIFSKNEGFWGGFRTNDERKEFREIYESNPERLIGLVEERMIDLMFTDPKYFEDPNALKKEIFENFLPSLYSQKLKILRQSNTIRDDPQTLIAFLIAAKNPNAVWTDYRGRIVFAGTAVNRDLYQNLQKNQVAVYISSMRSNDSRFRKDVKLDDLRFEYDKDENEHGHDILLTGVVTDMKTGFKFRVSLDGEEGRERVIVRSEN
jgi:hypothetical protein